MTTTPLTDPTPAVPADATEVTSGSATAGADVGISTAAASAGKATVATRARASSGGAGMVAGDDAVASHPTRSGATGGPRPRATTLSRGASRFYGYTGTSAFSPEEMRERILDICSLSGPGVGTDSVERRPDGSIGLRIWEKVGPVTLRFPSEVTLHGEVIRYDTDPGFGVRLVSRYVVEPCDLGSRVSYDVHVSGPPLLLAYSWSTGRRLHRDRFALVLGRSRAAVRALPTPLALDVPFF